MRHNGTYYFGVIAIGMSFTISAAAQETLRVELKPQMVTNEARVGDPTGLVDEQQRIIGPPTGKPTSGWTLNSKYWKSFPFSADLDLGKSRHLASIWLFDTNGKGTVVISAGVPGRWRKVATYDCAAYQKWAEIELNVTTRYLRITRVDPGANFTEIALYEYTPEAYQTLLSRREAKAKKAAARKAAMEKARREALRRPVIELAPYGKLSLVDEIDCADDPGQRVFAEYPRGASKVATILDHRARVLAPVRGEASYLSYRLGKGKLLRPGTAYVLVVEYPEDLPRTMIIINTGNETSRGFHTGPTVGDALHAKYVNNLPESVAVPLSGKWEHWSLLFHLHDRFPEKGLVRGPAPRPLAPEDGFDVTIAQFSARNAPLSHGIAVRRIRLFEVVDPERLAQPLTLPPAELPRRHLFWREEMADGTIDRKSKQPGIVHPLDWYRFKAARMHFLGMNTYCKDLLEFGACQHWDSSIYGGDDWVYYDRSTKDLWPRIVALMGSEGFDVLPYYEYSGSKGKHGLGNQRRARPLTRDDAYTHISWVESANADITDPDTYADFKKMLDLTIIRMRRKAPFVGAWIRSRGQLPVSFSTAALARFSHDKLGGAKKATRAMLRGDAILYDQYLAWWHLQRRRFLVAMHDYLRDNGIERADVLYTGCAAEPGKPFASWEPCIVTDQPDRWAALVKQPSQLVEGKGPMRLFTIQQVVQRNLYLKALLAPALNWGDWEVQHSRPADDPSNYRQQKRVLLTYPFNRNYTVTSAKTLAAYRTLAGLVIIRHYALNENMLFDQHDKNLLGYFVADIERAGPYCMMAEALAMANGDPTMIGYLVGNNFGRGFARYARAFNVNYLALPALPSRVIPDAASDPAIVVRRIDTPRFGTWIAIVNTSLQAKQNVTIALPAGTIRDAVTGKTIIRHDTRIQLDMYPCQLRSFRINDV